LITNLGGRTFESFRARHFHDQNRPPHIKGVDPENRLPQLSYVDGDALCEFDLDLCFIESGKLNPDLDLPASVT
jgi:hypothetical protein